MLDEARRTGATPTDAANRLADEAMVERHPIHGDRAARIVASLVEGDWAERPAGSP